MTNSQIDRRNFLSNMGILSIGVALSGVVKANILSTKNSVNIEKLWNNFYHQNGGKASSLNIQNKKEIVACKGHEHKAGQAIAFENEKIIAQPIWIYWANNKYKPSDVIINFYKLNDKEVVSINQYELRALVHLNKQATAEQNILEDIFKNKIYNPTIAKVNIEGRKSSIILSSLYNKRSSTNKIFFNA